MEEINIFHLFSSASELPPNPIFKTLFNGILCLEFMFFLFSVSEKRNEGLHSYMRCMSQRAFKSCTDVAVR